MVVAAAYAREMADKGLGNIIDGLKASTLHRIAG